MKLLFWLLQEHEVSETGLLFFRKQVISMHLRSEKYLNLEEINVESSSNVLTMFTEEANCKETSF